jgi:hypothetical protein
VIFLLLALLVFATSGFACLCAGEQTVEGSFKESTAIFTGKFIRSEWCSGIRSELHEIAMNVSGDQKRDYEVLVYVFAVDKWWKGAGTSEVVLISDHVRNKDGTESISDCGLGFEEGKDYLIYAYGQGDNFGTGACSRTRSLKRAKSDIKKLDRLAKPRSPFA